VTIAEARKALAEYRNWIVYFPNRGYRLAIPVADDQMKIGLLMAKRCTREGLEKALERFRLAAADRFDRRPLDAIARVYLMLGACSVNSSSEILAAFQPAHKQAVDLFGLTPALRSDRAQAIHLFERNRGEAERELLESARDQSDVITYLRLTQLYAGQGRFDCASESLQRARTLDQFDPGLPAAEMFLWLSRSDFPRAVEAGASALEVQPYFYPDRALYGQALEFSGRVEEALTQYRAAQTLAPDVPWLKALEAGCQARRGACCEAKAILAELRNRRTTTYVDSYYLAPVLYALNRRDEAFAELRRAREENSASLYAVDVDPKLDSLRTDRRFAAFRKGLFRS
jgi:tetratricopeptide (TPR) repeat protein